MSEAKILIVDDDPMVRESLMDELGEIWNVTECDSGEAAVELLDKRRFDAIVSDVRMPGMGGVALLKHAREAQPHAVRVFLTGYADAEVVEAARATGAYKLRKPWGDELELVLRQALERKAELDSARRELERRAQFTTMGALAASLAHDVRSPLSALRQNTELLAESTDEGERKALIEDNLTALESVERVVSSLRRVSEDPEAEESVKVAEVLSVVSRVVTRDCRRRGLDLMVEPMDSELVVRATCGELYQIVLNLVMNAVHASPSEGTIRLRAFQRDDQVVVEVEDEGPGVSPERQEAIFAPFETTKRDGLGLGLAISRDMARRHGGKLTVRGSQRGACFQLELHAA